MKKYLNFEEKYNLVNDIVESCVENSKLDIMQKEISKVILITKAFDEEYPVIKDNDGTIMITETYDALMKNGHYFKNIYSKIPKWEINLIEKLIDDTIDEKLRQGGTLQSIISKIESLDFKEIVKELKGLDIKKLKEIGKIVNINNGLSSSKE